MSPSSDAPDSSSQVVPPPAALLSRNPLHWFRFFGPGAIIASVTVGSGELVFPSRGGAIFGYPLLWVFTLGCLLKWVLSYTCMRHAILTGAQPMRRWTDLPGPRGWVPLSLAIIGFICWPIWISFLMEILGSHCAAVLPFGLDLYAWATIWTVVAVFLLMIGEYNFLEKAQIVILGLMLVGIFTSVYWVYPDWMQVLKGLFVPQALVYPEWAPQAIPSLKNRSEWVEVLVYTSVIGGVSVDYIGYSSFLRDKKWGQSHLGVADERAIARMASDPRHPARVWAKAVLIDTVTSFAMILVISAAFAVLGTEILRPERTIPDGVELLTYQASFLTNLGTWLKPFYDLAVFLAFFGILLGGPELCFRFIYEYLDTLPRCRDRVSARKLRMAGIVWFLGGSLAVLWLIRFLEQTGRDVDLLAVATPAGIYTGVFGCGIFCLANCWSEWRFLPPGLRVAKPLLVLNVVAGVLFFAAAIRALWQYGDEYFDGRGWISMVIVAVVIGVSLVTAQALRFVHNEPNE